MAKPAAKAISAIKTTPVIPILAAENVRNDCLLRHTRTLVAMRQRIAREERHRNGQHFAGGVCGSGRFRSPPRATGVEEKCRMWVLRTLYTVPAILVVAGLVYHVGLRR